MVTLRLVDLTKMSPSAIRQIRANARRHLARNPDNVQAREQERACLAHLLATKTATWSDLDREECTKTWADKVIERFQKITDRLPPEEEGQTGGNKRMSAARRGGGLYGARGYAFDCYTAIKVGDLNYCINVVIKKIADEPHISIRNDNKRGTPGWIVRAYGPHQLEVLERDWTRIVNKALDINAEIVARAAGRPLRATLTTRGGRQGESRPISVGQGPG